MSDITIRSSRSADSTELHRLAQLDSQVLPAGDLIVAEMDGAIVAAYAPESARSVADPFRRTADVVDLLKRAAAPRAAAPRAFRRAVHLPHAA